MKNKLDWVGCIDLKKSNDLFFSGKGKTYWFSTADLGSSAKQDFSRFITSSFITGRYFLVILPTQLSGWSD